MADDQQQRTRARSLEQDLLWSVLDQDAVPSILAMARDHWSVDAAVAWAALERQAALGRLRAYRGTGPFTPVDLAQVAFAEAEQDHELFVEPTEATHLRLREIGAETASA